MRVFCRARDFVAAPRLAAVILPPRQYAVYIRETVVVNRTVFVRDRGGYAVNPGIAPNIIASVAGRPVRAYDVRPRILAGTAQIPGAIEIRGREARDRNFRRELTIRETRTVIEPRRGSIPEPQPLAAGEQGRLGDNPPRAARRGDQPQEQQDRRQGRDTQDSAPTQGRESDERRREGRQDDQDRGRPGREQQDRRQGRDTQDSRRRKSGKPMNDAGKADRAIGTVSDPRVNASSKVGASRTRRRSKDVTPTNDAVKAGKAIKTVSGPRASATSKVEASRTFDADQGTLHRNQRRSDRHDLEQHVRSDPVIPARRRSVQALPA